MKTAQIINITMGGTYFHEGMVEVIECQPFNRATVKFSDGGIVERFVDPNAQGLSESELAKYIEDMNDK